MIIQTQAETADLLARITRIEQDIYARRHLIALRSADLLDGR